LIPLCEKNIDANSAGQISPVLLLLATFAVFVLISSVKCNFLLSSTPIFESCLAVLADSISEWLSSGAMSGHLSLHVHYFLILVPTYHFVLAGLMQYIARGEKCSKFQLYFLNLHKIHDMFDLWISQLHFVCRLSGK
jgi:hypothetical protein